MNERIETPDWRWDPSKLYADDEPEYPTRPDDARKHLQDFADARRDKYLSVKRMVAMGKRLLGDATLNSNEDWIEYLIMVRKWCEASEQEG